MFYRCLKLKEIHLSNSDEKKENCNLRKKFFNAIL